MKSWIRHVIFDLDGVLVDTKELHYQAFKKAVKTIAKINIKSSWYHKYDGITTREKLEILIQEGVLSSDQLPTIMAEKHAETLRQIELQIKPNEKITQLLTTLRDEGRHTLSIASNSRIDFVWAIVEKMKIRHFFTSIVGGDKVKFTKPHPEIYVKCMLLENANPAQTVIFEDSVVGLKAAVESGAHAWQCSVNSLTLEWVKSAIISSGLFSRASDTAYRGLNPYPYRASVVVPMAGHGSRFSKVGFELPKPLIDVRGVPMVQVTCDSVQIPGRYIFCVQDEHCVKFGQQIGRLFDVDDEMVVINGVTEGAACTVLKTMHLIDDDLPLFIVNSDQYIEWDWFRFMNEAESQKIDGGIVVFEANDPKWSYAKTEENSNVVTQVAEKNPISTHATAGIYYWRRGKDFVKFAKQMIEKNIRVNNEFYVCPVYNEAIEAGLKIITFPCTRMLGMGTPEDLQENLPKL